MPSLGHAAAVHLAKRYYVYGYTNYGLYTGLVFLFLLILICTICRYRQRNVVEVPVQQVVYATPVESLPMYTTGPAYATYSPADQVVYGTVPPQQLQPQQQQQQIFHRAPVDTGSDRLGTYNAPGYSNPNFYPVQGSTPNQAVSPTLNTGVAAQPPAGQPGNRVPTPENYYKS
ncbi:UNVERIFIED_CONTAM: hypothetical protein HDU68_007878 [Siphonaria sp. JEL0065]|nr:hypothetical protein HDU68_007878 [Siphonaria sp. JEL0065]